MNKLVIDPHGRNHFKFMAKQEMPDNEKEQIELIESIYKDLEKNGEIIFIKSKKGSYRITVVKNKSYYYIIVCIKNEFNTFNNTIYELESENDAIAIAKFVGKNITTTMSDYKKQILDAKKMMVRKEDIDEKDISQENNGKEN